MNKTQFITKKNMLLLLSAAVVVLMGWMVLDLARKNLTKYRFSREIKQIQTQSNSTDVNSIEKDLNDTNVSDVDKELQNIENELNQAY